MREKQHKVQLTQDYINDNLLTIYWNNLTSNYFGG